MIVEDGSSSFQNIWSTAVSADVALLNLINGVSVNGDSAGMVVFNDALPEAYLEESGLASAYSQYPNMNLGLKYTTDNNGFPLKVDSNGNSDPNGQVLPMNCQLTNFNTTNHTQLVAGLNQTCQVVQGGSAFGDTDTSVGLNYAINQLMASTNNSAQKTIVLVSDGYPHDYRGAYYTNLKTQAAIAAAQLAGADGIRIDTVTLSGTDGADYAFEASLVQNGGYALRAADPTQLCNILIAVGTIEVGTPMLLQ
jgi:hypothetical protein